MCQQQLSHSRKGGEASGLSGGEVAALAGEVLQLVSESAFEAEKVGALNEGDNLLSVSGIAAVGVDACGVGTAGHFGDAEAIVGDGMDEGEGVDGAAVVFEDALHAAFKVHLGEFQRIADVVACQLEGGLDDLTCPFGCHNGDGLGAAAEVHGGEEARETEEVVAVEVGDEDGADGLELEVAAADAVLCALGAVDQHLETVDVDDLGAASAQARGEGGSGTEYGGKEIHIFLAVKKFFSGTGDEEQEEGDEAVEEEYFEAEVVAKPLEAVDFQNIAYNRRDNGDDRHPTVAHLATGEESEGVETEEGTVGEARNIEQRVDEGLVVEGSEGNDYQQVEQCKGDMYNSADAQFFFLITLIILTELQEVVAESGGECREGAVGAAVARRHHAEHKDDSREAAEAEGYRGENLVGNDSAPLPYRQSEARGVGIRQQRGTETKEEDVDNDEEEAGGHDVLLRVTQGLAGEVFLHHVLVEARHGDGDEHAGDNLLPIELRRGRIGLEHAGVSLLGRSAQEFGEAYIQRVENCHHSCRRREKEEGSLQHVGPDHGLDAAAESVEQDDGDEDHRRHPEGNPPYLEDELIEHKDNKIHTQRGAQETRNDEEESPRFLARHTEALVEVGVDGGEIQFVV